MIAKIARALAYALVIVYLTIGIIAAAMALGNPYSHVNPWLIFLAWPAYAVRGV